MAEIETGVSLFPNGVPWLYAVFAMLSVFFLFVLFSPFLLEIDQYIKKCKYRDLRKQRTVRERMSVLTWGKRRHAAGNEPYFFSLLQAHVDHGSQVLEVVILC